MLDRWEYHDARHFDEVDDSSSPARRAIYAVETTVMAGAASFFTATLSMWAVETFIR